MEEKDSRKEPQSSFRGLYRHVKISVKTLDKIIVGGIAAIIILGQQGILDNILYTPEELELIDKYGN